MKIFKTYHLSSLLILLIACFGPLDNAAAQNAVMNVRSRQTVAAGQTFQITFDVNGRASDFKMPSLKNLTHVGGPSQGYSRSSSNINGKVTRSESYTFTILVQADKEGTANVGAASCVVDGTTIHSKPFTVKVEKADPNSRNRQQQSQGGWGWGWGQPQQQQQPQQEPSKSIDKNTLFARASINKSNLYQGEEAIIVYKIYTQVPLTQFQIEKLPRNKGFWSEDLSEGQTKVKQYSETVNGRQYQVAEIRRGALYPQESGKLTIAPLQTDVVAIIQTQLQRQRTGTILDFFIDDPFFTPTQQQAVVKSLTSNSISVNVKPLPEAPAGFAGGVGNFQVKTSSDVKSLKANESFTYSVTISGRGNLSLLEAPEIQFPQGLDVYEPRVVDKINKGDNGLSGSRTFEWVVTPQTQGDYEIPALDYVYFNPASGSYTTVHGDAIQIKVGKGDSHGSKSDVKVLNSDIHHIQKNGHLRHHDSARPTLWFWILMVIPIVIAIAVILWARRQQEIAGDEGSMRLQRATKLARKRLRMAERHLHSGNDELFYEEIYKALWGGISDKFNIPLASLSSETIRQHLAEKQVDEALQQRILQTLSDVDFARFAPGDSSSKKQNIYDEAMNTIMQIGVIKVKDPRKNNTKNTLALLIMLLGIGAAAPLHADTPSIGNPEELFAKANSAYDSGAYSQALACYSLLESEGWSSWQLYYNIGNCHFRMDSIGKSILYYHRALRLSPRNKQVQDNLELAQSKATDHIEQLPKMFLVQWFDAQLQITTPRGWRTLTLIALFLLCLTACIFFISSEYKVRKWMFVVGAIVLFFLIIFAFDATFSARKETMRKEAIVTAPLVVVKGAPDANSVDKFVVHEGTLLTINEEDDTWWHITLADGKEGWIASGAERI